MTLRRDFLSMTAGAVAARTVLPAVAKAEGVVAANEAPDADLIAVCAEFDACKRQQSIIYGTGPGSIKGDAEATAASMPIHSRMEALLGRMHDLRATTPDGIQARAHSLALHAGHGAYSFDYDDTIPGRLLNYLMRDAAALGASGIVMQVTLPDASLIAACNEFVDLEQQANATFGGYEDDDPREIAAEAERDQIYAKQDPLMGLICEHRAVTAEGHRARARALFTWDAGLMNPGECCFDRRMTAAIVRDLLAMPAI